MARIQDLKFVHRVFTKGYRFRQVEWHPGARLSRPLSESKLSLITTAALHLPSQPAFDHSVLGGDWSFREIPGTVEVNQLQISHRSSAFNQAGALEDRNLVFPLDRLRELLAKKKLGALNHRHFSFMGSIIAPEKLVARTAPAVAGLLTEDHVDAVLLIPV